MKEIDVKAKFTKGLKRSRSIRRIMLILPAIILAVIVFCAIFADLIMPYSPVENSLTERYIPPVFMEGGSLKHIFGTDSLGRDIFSRVIYGSRISISIGVIVVLINSVIAACIGIISGYFGGRVDNVIMRICDITLAYPALLTILILAAVMGPGFITIVFAMTLTGWAILARTVRGEALRIRHLDFIAQARINGCSSKRIMIKHFFPNVLNTMVVIGTMSIPGIIMMEATFSFLGIGFPPPTPSWGAMVADGRGYVDTAWWISVFPSLAIALLVISMNYLGDWLRDRMDPLLREI